MTGTGQLAPPIDPMLARACDQGVQEFHEVAFEPKWDGFRCLAFHLPNAIVLQGRGRTRGSAEFVDLSYAFPELVEVMAAATTPGTVIDGEIVLRRDDHLDFAGLTSRLRPRGQAAGGSISRLADELPATFLAFDLLAHGRSLMEQPYQARSDRLADLAAGWPERLRLTPRTMDHGTAASWFTDYECTGVDGLIVKPIRDPYQPGLRAQWKLKHHRSADVVVAGWRPKVTAEGSEVVASLLLGLYEDDVLHYIGGTAAFTDATRRDLVPILGQVLLPDGVGHPWLDDRRARAPGGPSRWGAATAWRALAPSLVAEVGYDQLHQSRFRHPASFIRWRPDRDPRSCDFGQFPRPQPTSIGRLLDWAAP